MSASESARMRTMREFEATALFRVMEREKRNGGSKFGTPENRVGLTPYEEKLLSDFEEQLRPEFDLEEFLERLKTPSKDPSSFGGSVSDQLGILRGRLPPPTPREYLSPEEAWAQMLAPVQRLEEYAVQLALDDAKWKRSGVSSKSAYVKEEAIKFLKDTFGSSGKDKFSRVYEDAENAFFCFLYEDEAKAIEGKDEVVQIRLLDEIMLLRLYGLSSYYTMMKRDSGFGMPVGVTTVFDL